MLTGKELDILYPYDKPVKVDPDRVSQIVLDASTMYAASLMKQIIKMVDEPDDHLRASLVGKAAIDVLGRKFFSTYYGGISSPRFRQLFHDGDVWESDYYTWLATRGVEFLSTQGETEYWGVPGHYDYIVRVGDKKVLLELKTANKGYFSSLLKQQSTEDVALKYGYYRPYFASSMTDFRGHITQIALYRESLGVDEAVIVVKSKDSADILLYPVPDTTNELQRVQQIVRAWETCEEWSDVYSHVGIPEPRKELRSRSHTGRYLVPPKLYGSPIIPLIYEWIREGDRTIIVGYRIPESARVPQTLFESYSQLDIYTYPDSDIPELLNEWRDYDRLINQDDEG